MPPCLVCKRVLASVELRRTPKGHRCKDRLDCERKAKERGNDQG